jgi:hypothetical protein
MAKECMQNCWRIQQAVESSSNRKLLSGPLAIHPDYMTGDDPVQNILSICEVSYDCDGPGTTEVEVVKGIFKKRTEMEERPTCGLPDSYFEN